MKYLYLVPFSYFLNSRLKHANVMFHCAFEWVAAALLVTLFGKETWLLSLTQMLWSYLAFISLYEIGYIANDTLAKTEENGRVRGIEQLPSGLILSLIVSRLICFLLFTTLVHKINCIEWWSFYAALVITFSLHNILKNKALKFATFTWLAWFRFMAPIFFVVSETQRFGIALAAAMTYVSFRSLAYLDSKDMLKMSARQSAVFRQSFFLTALVGVVAFWPYPEAYGFLVLVIYYAVIASLGSRVAS